jgi:hypothetical protein
MLAAVSSLLLLNSGVTNEAFGRRENSAQTLHDQKLLPVAASNFSVSMGRLEEEICKGDETCHQCANLLEKYLATHRRILALPANHRDRRYVIYRCNSAYRCRGLGDQLKGLLGSLRLAMLDDRALLLDAFVLEQLFKTMRMQWSYSAAKAANAVLDLTNYEIEMKEFFTENRSPGRLYKTWVSPNVLAITHFNVDMPYPPYNNTHVPKVIVNLGNTANIEGHSICKLGWNNGLTHSFLALHRMFQLSPTFVASVRKLATWTSALMDHQNGYTVGVQIRSGDTNLFYRPSRNPLFAKKQQLEPAYFEVMERARKLANEVQQQRGEQDVRIFFSSDNSRLRTIAQKAGMLVLPVSPTHAEFAGSEAAVMGAVADWVLLTQSDFFLCHNCHSGYIESAMAFSKAQCNTAQFASLCDKYGCGNQGFRCQSR